MARRGGGFAVVFGRRRIGKTRLLLEWVRRHGGVYTVADHSTPEVQRRYLADALATRLPGFGDVAYPDWRAWLSRLARDAAANGWRGPVVLDELPYLVQASPELPAVLQRWLDHEARDLVVAVAGSSQHMMQSLALAADAPLFGRAREILEIRPLAPRWLSAAFGSLAADELVGHGAAWGGVPRYWELAREAGGTVTDAIDRLVLDPLAPLHQEPDRLIAEELPAATEVRPLLDAIGGGAHRVSEIGARIGRPATALQRPLQRLIGMGLVRREVPFDDAERSGKRSLYQIDDPLTRLWFRVVAPHRAQLAAGGPASRHALLARHWPGLLAAGWADLCRGWVPGARGWVGDAGPWGPASRWWRGSEPEWDVVARSLDGRRLLLGEVKLTASAADVGALRRRPPPAVAGADGEVVRVLFALHGGGPEGVGPEEVLQTS